jgi:hypothetical protein
MFFKELANFVLKADRFFLFSHLAQRPGCRWPDDRASALPIRADACPHIGRQAVMDMASGLGLNCPSPTFDPL